MFKVGDRIKRIKSYGTRLTTGQIYTVSSVNEYGEFKLADINNEGYDWYPGNFKLCNSKITNWKKRIQK